MSKIFARYPLSTKVSEESALRDFMKDQVRISNKTYTFNAYYNITQRNHTIGSICDALEKHLKLPSGAVKLYEETDIGMRLLDKLALLDNSDRKLGKNIKTMKLIMNIDPVHQKLAAPAGQRIKVPFLNIL